MAAYIIARIKVTDSARYREYTLRTPEVIARYDGRFVIRGGEVHTLEGPREQRRIVVLEFPTFERAKEFYYSPDYQELKKLRLEAAEGELVLVPGV
jgi:uncharacterized protein (DUF1330 family)